MDMLSTLPSDRFVSAAFAELLEDVTNLLSATEQSKPLDKAEISFWKRQLNALNKAESYWLQGIRPQISASAYLLASASRPGALVHRLAKVGGIAVCSCEAGQKQQLCWHHMLVNVLERATELESRDVIAEEVSSGPDTTPEAARALLAVRLVETARVIDAMRAAQGRGDRGQATDRHCDSVPCSLSPVASCDPPNEGPSLGDEEGDSVPDARRLGVRLAQARRRSAYFTSAFYPAA